MASLGHNEDYNTPDEFYNEEHNGGSDMMEKNYKIDTEDFENEYIKTGVSSVVYFYSDDCPHCSAFNQIFERSEEALKDKIKFIKIFRQMNRSLAEKYNVTTSPTVIFFKDGEEACARLTGYINNPEFKQSLENLLGGKCEFFDRSLIKSDLLVLGSGPAGLAAAIYAARSKLDTIVIDEGMVGGQVTSTYTILNYPGTNGAIRGLDLVENMKRQAVGFGAKIHDLKEILEINLEGPEKHVKTEDSDYYAKVLIIATGSRPRKLPAEGEREYYGRGIHYCAMCDGALYQDTNLIVVGGGNSAAEESVFLTRYAKKVTIVSRYDQLRASKSIQEEVFKNPEINVIWNSEVKKVSGRNFVDKVEIENVITKEKTELDVDGVFVYIGMEPRTELFNGKLKLDDYGFIVTDEDMKTNISGVFAAGDVREKNVRQIVTAVSDGAIAGIMAEKFINGR